MIGGLLEGRAEAIIQSAIERGELDDLPGVGAPLLRDDDSVVPQELRMAYRILRNAGFVPEEVAVRREIAELELLLGDPDSMAKAVRARARLDMLRTRLVSARGEGCAWVADRIYRTRLLERFGRECGMAPA